MSEWQDISTARQDGTSIWLFGGVMGDTMSYMEEPQTTAIMGFWDITHCRDSFWNCGNCGGHDEYWVLKNPTHWMPFRVPAPPKEAANV